MMQQRARHLSLDFTASPQQQQQQEEEENWSQLLSTSIAALATDEPPPSDSSHTAAVVVTHEDELFFAQHQQDVMDAAVAVATSPRSRPPPAAIDTLFPPDRTTSDEYAGLKPRSDSVSEALTSSTESSPSGAAWRPLGRRVSANGSANQLEYTLFEVPTLPHTTSFRDAVHVSSSGSSLYESSSSSDDEQPPVAASHSTSTSEATTTTTRAFRMMMRKGSAPALTMRPSLLDADAPPFGDVPLLAPPLPSHPRSLSIDNTFGSGSSTLHPHHHHHLAKSPVLGNRKDSQTWQLQDEELLKTSPRFGPLGSGDLSMFGTAGLLAECVL